MTTYSEKDQNPSKVPSLELSETKTLGMASSFFENFTLSLTIHFFFSLSRLLVILFYNTYDMITILVCT